MPLTVPGDDFTLPAAASSYQVTDVRIWLEGYGSTPFSDMFNSVSLMLGQGNGSLSKLAVTPTVTAVTFPGGVSGSDQLWQLDYSVDVTAAGGAKYSFAIYPDAKAVPSPPGTNNETYYIAFLDATRTGYSSGYPNDSSDSLVKEYNLDGTYNSHGALMPSMELAGMAIIACRYSATRFRSRPL